MSSSVIRLLVRHAQQQAENGAVGRLSPLSELGHLQAQALAAGLATACPPSVVYTSPLPRAASTAAAVCERLSLKPMLEPRLEEFELGTRSLHQIAERSDLLIWQPEHTGAGGETLRSFSQRVGAFCDELAVRHPSNAVAVISHAGTIDAAVRWALGMGSDTPWQHELEVQHASITEVECWPSGRIAGGSPRYAVVRRVNDIRHLGDLTSDL